jgi:hypothetical protein
MRTKEQPGEKLKLISKLNKRQFKLNFKLYQNVLQGHDVHLFIVDLRWSGLMPKPKSNSQFYIRQVSSVYANEYASSVSRQNPPNWFYLVSLRYGDARLSLFFLVIYGWTSCGVNFIFCFSLGLSRLVTFSWNNHFHWHTPEGSSFIDALYLQLRGGNFNSFNSISRQFVFRMFEYCA